jgi:glycosyltransferase involved in cell wall biosynthesis/GT2 family glycosyltransferase
VTSVSAVIPVKDGARYLGELLAALVAQGVDEILVIDSGSRDASVAIARGAGADVLEIPPASFGHGATRNLGAERTRGELICFLTQDATPTPGWIDAYREAMALAPGVGAAYGPHLARPDTSPMIARELDEFFAGFSSDGAPVLQRPGDAAFLSNVNACYARACWAEIRFREVPYAEDQAFGADMFAAGWLKVYHPRAAVLHAHDYGWSDFMRRYFDEYRGLRETIGHLEPFGLRTVGGHVRRSVAGDLRWLAGQDTSPAQMSRWAVASAAHHGGRRVFSALGSRAERLPSPIRRRLSLEQRSASAGPDELALATGQAPSPVTQGRDIPPLSEHEFYAAVGEAWRRGPTPLLDPVRGLSQRPRLRLAMVVPAFSRGSGGHALLLEILSRLEARGHICTVWVQDYSERFGGVAPGVLRRTVNEFFAPISGPVYNGLADWHGADIVIATGWQTVHPVLRLPNCYQRVYIVNDHEPEFFATSTESVLAADTYRHGIPCIAGSPWLRDLLVERYGADAEVFEYGVDHAVYRPRPLPRRGNAVVYYARHETARRAVPLGLMALAELKRRRPDVQIVMFGSEHPPHTSFPYRHLGIMSPQELARLYSEATVGLCLSLTNVSLMPKEMMACGLPCVEVEGASAESIFGKEGPLELARLQPSSIADALERLLDDRALWERRSRAGLAYVKAHTWDRATDEVEAGLRRALARREAELPVSGVAP